jgi:hypothetical protein
MNGALNVNGTVTATNFSGSGTGLTGIGTSNLAAITGTPSTTTYLRGDGTWGTIGGTLSGGVASYIPLWTSATAIGTSNIYQNGSNIGIGTAGATFPDVNGSIRTNASLCQRPECRNHYFFRSQLCWHRDDNTFNRAASRR